MDLGDLLGERPLGWDDTDAPSESSRGGCQHLGLDFEAGSSSATEACVVLCSRDLASLSG